jgi:hypothetical protein
MQDVQAFVHGAVFQSNLIATTKLLNALKVKRAGDFFAASFLSRQIGAK